MAAKRRRRKRLPRGVCRTAKGRFVKCSVKRARRKRRK